MSGVLWLPENSALTTTIAISNPKFTAASLYISCILLYQKTHCCVYIEGEFGNEMQKDESIFVYKSRDFGNEMQKKGSTSVASSDRKSPWSVSLDHDQIHSNVCCRSDRSQRGSLRPSSHSHAAPNDSCGPRPPCYDGRGAPHPLILHPSASGLAPILSYGWSDMSQWYATLLLFVGSSESFSRD